MNPLTRSNVMTTARSPHLAETSRLEACIVFIDNHEAAGTPTFHAAYLAIKGELDSRLVGYACRLCGGHIEQGTVCSCGKRTAHQYEALDEAEAEAVGRRIVHLFDLKPITDKWPVQYDTAIGTKTLIGLGRTVNRILCAAAEPTGYHEPQA